HAERPRADVVLLRDEQVETAQNEQHGDDEQRVPDDRAREIARQNGGHAGSLGARLNQPSRASSHKPTASAMPCTHHIPTYSGTRPLSIQARLASRSSE